MFDSPEFSSVSTAQVSCDLEASESVSEREALVESRFRLRDLEGFHRELLYPQQVQGGLKV